MRRSLLFLLGGLLACGRGEEEYSFTLDGEALDPEIIYVYGEPGRTVAGDLASAAGQSFVLDGAGTYTLESFDSGHSPDPWPDQLYRVLPDQSRQLIARSFSRLDDLSLTESEWRGLRSVRFHFWSPDVLELLDAERCHVEIDVMTPDVDFGKLPGDLHYLTPPFSLTDQNQRALTRLKNLVFLDFRQSWDFHSDGGPACEGIGCCPIGYLRELDQLRTLYLDWTGASNLAPLGAHPSLRYLSVDNTPLRTLPKQPLPRLRHCSALVTDLKDEEVGRFAAENPHCLLETDLIAVLAARVENAVRLRIRRGPNPRLVQRPGFAPVPQDQVLFEGSDRRDIDELLELLAIIGGFRGHGTMNAYGDRRIEFCDSQGRCIAYLGVLRDKRLRCPGLWPRWVDLTEAAEVRFGAWMVERGVQR